MWELKPPKFTKTGSEIVVARDEGMGKMSKGVKGYKLGIQFQCTAQ